MKFRISSLPIHSNTAISPQVYFLLGKMCSQGHLDCLIGQNKWGLFLSFLRDKIGQQKFIKALDFPWQVMTTNKLEILKCCLTLPQHAFTSTGYLNIVRLFCFQVFQAKSKGNHRTVTNYRNDWPNHLLWTLVKKHNVFNLHKWRCWERNCFGMRLHVSVIQHYMMWYPKYNYDKKILLT